jgi:hypothetical protein
LSHPNTETVKGANVKVKLKGHAISF